jgi:branched-chain amino acid aminotransferase
MVAAWAWGAYLGEEGMQRGIRVKTQLHPPPCEHHHEPGQGGEQLHQLHPGQHRSAGRRLRRSHLLDASGFVSEGSGENIFVIKDGVVYTPDLSAGALNGITRNTVFHICKDLGLEVVQKRITRDEVYIADEVFFTGTAAEVTPIREVDRLPIGEGRRGPITEKIQNAFFDIVNGRNPKYTHWLTRV